MYAKYFIELHFEQCSKNTICRKSNVFFAPLANLLLRLFGFLRWIDRLYVLLLPPKNGALGGDRGFTPRTPHGLRTYLGAAIGNRRFQPTACFYFSFFSCLLLFCSLFFCPNNFGQLFSGEFFAFLTYLLRVEFRIFRWLLFWF